MFMRLGPMLAEPPARSRAMRDFSPQHSIWHRDRDARDQAAAHGDAYGPYPTPAGLYFQIGQTLAVALGAAVAANLVAIALGG